ncbi:MAG TPA: FAD-binding and (Fe-S)-binding domain-containing protein [Polyangiaceae bacterium]
MIPILKPDSGLQPEYTAYLDALRTAGFEGEIQVDYATRLVTATDNSVYQIVPQAVAFPKHALDVQRALKLLGTLEFRNIKVSPRGAGTGTNGQSLCDGVIFDLSRHLNRIVEVDLDAGWVIVEPGVVLDQLNAHLKPHGVFFAPNLSPSNRATLGGMINTDAAGKGSRIYGKTSNHVIELDVVLGDGSSWTSRELTESELSEIKRRPDPIGAVHRAIDAIVTEKRHEIAEQFPKLKRFLTGYNLAHVYSADRTRFNLNYILAGAEGTLAFITRAKLRLTPLPKFKKLVAIRYSEFDDALSAASELVELDPAAIETVDDTIVALARQDTIWHRVAHLVEGTHEPLVKAINLVEFQSDRPELVEERVERLCELLRAQRGAPGKASGFSVATHAKDIDALWALRKKGVGLLGALSGLRRPIPFVEDSAVPPEHLASYIREFRALLDGYGLKYGMFGHVDVGCMHVRPALNMRQPEDEALLREISDAVVKLVKRYGGVLWGEHGKGFRSEYVPTFFGDELYQELRKVKQAFDPYNQLNPGKLATPASSSDKLVSIDGLKRGAFDRQLSARAQTEFAVTVNCNGNGACFDYNPDNVMCPSSKVTRDRIHSPKGRAGIMREWLRLMTLDGHDATRAGSDTLALEPLFQGRRSAPRDFNHEVYDAMNGCLACKACATQCPIKVDVPQFRSRFFELYHTRYRRPLKDYFVASLELVLPAMAMLPGLVNWVLTTPWVSGAMARWVGIVDTPLLSRINLTRELARRGAPEYDPEALAQLPAAVKANSVLLLQDAFTTFYEANVVLACYDLLSRLGFTVYVMPFRENGKGLHVKGFLARFRDVARANATFLGDAARTGIDIIGLDPAVVLTYRDEYREVLGSSDSYRVQLVQEWLAAKLKALDTPLEPRASGTFQLFGHCTERTAEPQSQAQWASVFAAFGSSLRLVDLGCCGMCGAYGHESTHRAESEGVFAMSWARALPTTDGDRERVLATGHSCRSQVKRFAGFTPLHPLEALEALTRN